MYGYALNHEYTCAFSSAPHDRTRSPKCPELRFQDSGVGIHEHQGRRVQVVRTSADCIHIGCRSARQNLDGDVRFVYGVLNMYV